ncbi:MAG: patatin-like phospholipase family protein [Fimbriimonadaceae bacterium]|nr:patatin-like phospholipase family protein [Fimbriimonadaceae bacterium]
MTAFSEVLRAELRQVHMRRHRTSPPERNPIEDFTTETTVERDALNANLVGLAFSGGGIRSATFNLGVLQGLARLGLIKHVDYLSTVSGGGYIGAWLATWIAREGAHEPIRGGSVANVERQLSPSRLKQASAKRVRYTVNQHSACRESSENPISTQQLPRESPADDEPAPIHHLRAYSNYLAPKLGFLSADSWTLIATYLRNLLLNQLLLLCVALILIVLMRFVVCAFASSGDSVRSTIYLLLLAMCLPCAMITFTFELAKLHDPRSERRGISLARMHLLVLLPLLVSAWTATWLFTGGFDSKTGGMAQEGLRLPEWLGFPISQEVNSASTGRKYLGLWKSIWLVVVFGGLNFVVNFVVCLLSGPRKAFKDWRGSLRTMLAGASSGGMGGLLLFLVLNYILWPAAVAEYSPALMVTIGPPSLLIVFVVAGFLEVGFLGNDINEAEREWWSRVSAWCLIAAVVWVAAFGVSLFGHPLMLWLGEQLAATVTFGWVVTSLGGALAGGSRSTRDGRGNRIFELVGMVAPYVFIAGLAILVSWAVSLYVRQPSESIWATYNAPSLSRLRAIVVLAVGGGALLSLCIDVNIFSLNAMYANRLIRCYLGASRPWLVGEPAERRRGAATCSAPPIRHENPVTGMDSADDFALRELTIGPTEQKSLPTYWGPFPVINTALNLVAGKELAWQERKAESFILTPLFCGSESTGYQNLGRSADANLTVGRAISISGAAASPNMGYHSSSALTALMAVFNVRLGWWMRNPATGKQWAAQGPGFGLWLVHELLGLTDESSSYVYLSDGGHFENLGIYELVRRRCKYIIACDASADPAFTFDDLAAAIRKVRVDFGIRIEIDIDSLRKNGSEGCTAAHCAVGRVRYSDVHQDAGEGQTDGILVYMKASVTGDETPDIVSYRERCPQFPHQPTGDQFFSETQFESYRGLGEHIIGQVFGAAQGHTTGAEEKLGASDSQEPALSHEETRAICADLFERLSKDWQVLPPGIAKSFAAATTGYIAVHSALRSDQRLKQLSRSLYPQMFQDGDDEPSKDRKAAEFHFVCQLLQVLEEVWHTMRLDDYPDNRLTNGWGAFMKRAFESPIVQAHWSEVRSEFSSGFNAYLDRLTRLRNCK